MSEKPRTLVSVVTPFFNEEPYLAECIASVLKQDYTNFEYILVDNMSTDSSLAIARESAGNDSRVRIVEADAFLPQIQNFNRALGLINKESRYTKMILADDWLYPDCLRKMVDLAEQDPSIVAVSSYNVLDWGNRASVYLDGLPVRQKIIPGREICRRFLLDGLYVFGSPSVGMFRSDAIRNRDEFFVTDEGVEDVDAFFEILDGRSLGFVHQVLSFTRRDNLSKISALNKFDLMTLTRYVATCRHGHRYLSEEELTRAIGKWERRYYNALAAAKINRAPSVYWDFHRAGLSRIGKRIYRRKLLAALGRIVVKSALNPRAALERLKANRSSK